MPPPCNMSAWQSHTHTRAKMVKPAILTKFFNIAKLANFSHISNKKWINFYAGIKN